MPALSSTNYLDDRTRRDPPRKKLRPADVITRAAVCELLRAQVRPGEIEDPAAVVDRVYDRCPATRAYLDLERAAVNPASTSVAGWAQELVQSSIADFLAGPQGASAFAQLANQAMSITLPAGTGVMKIPSLAATLVGGWVGESWPSRSRPFRSPRSISCRSRSRCSRRSAKNF